MKPHFFLSSEDANISTSKGLIKVHDWQHRAGIAFLSAIQQLAPWEMQNHPLFFFLISLVSLLFFFLK